MKTVAMSSGLPNIYDEFIYTNVTTTRTKLMFLAVFLSVVTTSCFKLTTLHILTASMLKGFKLKDLCRRGNQQKG